MTDNRKNILLITGAIDISSYQIPATRIIDLQERLQQYLYSIEYAIDHYHKVGHIVFCENTNYKYDYSFLQEKARRQKKVLEVLTFSGDYENIQNKGKGYGEGEIIKYALANSKQLQKSQFFYKLTGRVIITNMDRVVKSTYCANAFIFPPDFTQMDENNDVVETIFYKVDTLFFKQQLIDAYLEVNDRQNRYLEHVFFDKIKHLPINSFRVYPIMVGYSASTGGVYTKSKIILLKNSIYNKLGFFANHRTSFQRFLFNIIRFVKQV